MWLNQHLQPIPLSMQPLEGGRPGDAREMAFATVTITEGSGAEQKVGGVRAAQQLSRLEAVWSLLCKCWCLPANHHSQSPSLAPHQPSALSSQPLQANNVAEMLLIRGLAQVIKHRADEERSGARWGWRGEEAALPHAAANVLCP